MRSNGLRLSRGGDAGKSLCIQMIARRWLVRFAGAWRWGRRCIYAMPMLGDIDGGRRHRLR